MTFHHHGPHQILCSSEQCSTYTLIILTLPLTILPQTASFSGSITLHNSTHIYTLSPGNIMSLPIHSLGLTALKSLCYPRTNKFLSSRIPSPKGWTLPTTHCSLNVSFTYHPCQCTIRTLLTTNGYSIKRMKLMNSSHTDRNFQTDTSPKVLDDKELICYAVPGDNCDTQWKFALTNSMIWPTIDWFHTMLGHPGSCGMRATLQAQYHHPHLQMCIEQFACGVCQ